MFIFLFLFLFLFLSCHPSGRKGVSPRNRASIRKRDTPRGCLLSNHAVIKHAAMDKNIATNAEPPHQKTKQPSCVWHH